MKRLLLLVPSTTYRATDFLLAASRLEVEVLVGSERRQTLEKISGRTATINFRNSDKGFEQILNLAKEKPFDAVVAVDDEAVVLAARAADALKLRHNNPSSVSITSNKYLFRKRLEEMGVSIPAFRLGRTLENPHEIANRVSYPCVLKPVTLCASQGVIRANNSKEFVSAFKRIKHILRQQKPRNHGVENDDLTHQILIEGYIPGVEVALEGLLTGGKLKVLALFDKPDPLEGPFFEESIYVTPSRLLESQQKEIIDSTQEAISAIGLEEGPVHAELRLSVDGPIIIELAARSIGGLCARTLEFGAGIGLEELILRHALLLPIEVLDRERSAAGVMMLPIPKKGILRAVSGQGAALAVRGIKDLTISIPIGQKVIPVPEGRQYLGFLFAKADTPEVVETALRNAHRHLEFEID